MVFLAVSGIGSVPVLGFAVGRWWSCGCSRVLLRGGSGRASVRGTGGGDACPGGSGLGRVVSLVLPSAHSPNRLLAGRKCANPMKNAVLWARLCSPPSSGAGSRCGTSARGLLPPAPLPGGEGRETWRRLRAPCVGETPNGGSLGKGSGTAAGTHSLPTRSPGWLLSPTCCRWHRPGDVDKPRCLPRRAPARETGSFFFSLALGRLRCAVCSDAGAAFRVLGGDEGGCTPAPSASSVRSGLEQRGRMPASRRVVGAELLYRLCGFFTGVGDGSGWHPLARGSELSRVANCP